MSATSLAENLTSGAVGLSDDSKTSQLRFAIR
jgi:hypothetical protein